MTQLGKQVDISKWISTQFGKGKTPPFSFVYGERPSDEVIRGWEYTWAEVAGARADVIERQVTYRDPKTGFKVRCDIRGFVDFNAVEWTLHFTNESPSNSPILEQVQALDHTLNSPTKGDFSLYKAFGSIGIREDFMVTQVMLPRDSTFRMAPQGGRSSDYTAFPFFNLVDPLGQQGVLISVGWTGGWQASLSHNTPQGVAVSAGQERLLLYLKPGEEIRSPRMCLLFWQGEGVMAGQNKFRRFVLTHVARQEDGKFIEYPYAAGFAPSGPAPCTENTCLTTDMAIAMARRQKQFDLIPEVLWLDAGWYTDSGAPIYDWCDCVGTWTPDSTRFPDGLRPIADEVHRLGAKFLVWFEPERVSRGSWLACQKPEWLLHSKIRNSALLDLGNPDALNWLCTHVGDMIERETIDYYRQDFNHPALPFWEENEAPDRIGMMEIRHIEGLYAFWDYLITRFPRLRIDNCAAGGRRIDLETLARSAPLWRTDYSYGEVTGYQSHSYGLNFFLPQHGTGMWATDDYSTRSSLGTSVVCNWDLSTNKLKVADIQKAAANFKRYRPYFYEDYYPLTGLGNTTGDDIWLAYQLHRPSDASGIVVAFRRPGARADRITVQLGGLKPESDYALVDRNTEVRTVIKGKVLQVGYPLYIPQKKGSLLIEYQEITK